MLLSQVGVGGAGWRGHPTQGPQCSVQASLPLTRHADRLQPPSACPRMNPHPRHHPLATHSHVVQVARGIHHSAHARAPITPLIATPLTWCRSTAAVTALPTRMSTTLRSPFLSPTGPHRPSYCNPTHAWCRSTAAVTTRPTRPHTQAPMPTTHQQPHSLVVQVDRSCHRLAHAQVNNPKVPVLVAHIRHGARAAAVRPPPAARLEVHGRDLLWWH